MTIYHSVNATHFMYKDKVLVAISPAVARSLRSMNWCVITELPVWLLN